jgi:hypothetical protein
MSNILQRLICGYLAIIRELCKISQYRLFVFSLPLPILSAVAGLVRFGGQSNQIIIGYVKPRLFIQYSKSTESAFNHIVMKAVLDHMP